MSLRSLLGGAYRPRNETPVPYSGRSGSALGMLLGGGGGSPREELEQYGEIGTLFGVVSKLASTTSLVNWRLYRKAASGIDEDRQEITGFDRGRSAPLKVWTQPNPWMARQEFVETFQQHIDLTGLAYWVLTKLGTTPVEIWPVRPDRMSVVESREQFISGYVYTSPDGERVPLLPDQVIMLRWPAPLDIYGGQSPLSALRGDLEGEEAQRAWSRSFYENSALPGGILETGTRLSDDEFSELVSRWNAQHRGIQNAGRVAVLEQGKFVPMAYGQRDMQFVETRGLTKQAILDAYGFPKFGLGDVQDVNRASADASKAYMAESLTVPRLERIKGALNGDFLRLYGMDATHEFDYDNPIPEDRETENATLTAKVGAVATLVNAGADPGDACDVVGLPRIVWQQRGTGVPASA